MGAGNAFIAIADDATAASWNPGGLSQLEAPELSLALEGLQRSEASHSEAHPEAQTAGSLRLQDLNYMSVVQPFFYGRQMVLSLNYLKLYSFHKQLQFPFGVHVGSIGVDMDYDLDQEGDFSALTPAFGIDVTRKLALGIAVNVWNHDLTQSSAYRRVESSSGTLTLDPSSAAGLLQSRFTHVFNEEFEVDEGYSVVLGALYRLSQAWTLGAVVKPAYTLRLDHTTHDYYNQWGNLGSTAGPQVTPPRTTSGELSFPTILGGGVAWRPADAFTASLDVTWTDWSQYQYSEHGQDTNPLSGERVSVSQPGDTFTSRIGAEYVLIFRRCLVPLRCGIGYDPSPGVGSTDDFYALSGGVGVQLGKRWNFDVAYEFRWGNEVNGATLQGIEATQDVRQHRVLASVILYY